MVDQNEQTLLEAARAGDQDALEALLLQQQERIYRFGMKFCRNAEDAKDVLQDTLFAMARSVRDFQGRSSISTWLYTIARSFCIKKRRKSKFEPQQLASLEDRDTFVAQTLADGARSPDEVLAGKEVETVLAAAISQLDPEHRDVLLLRDVEGLTAKEVAEVLEISVSAVKSRLHRARLKVRQRVAPMLADGRGTAPAAGACPDVLTLYSKHLEGEISADLCAQMEAHVAQCERCRGACDSLKQTLALCSRTPRTEVPQEVQTSVRSALHKFLEKG